jgi:hypothetical protein
MKALILICALGFAVTAVASPLHLDLEMSSEEYRSILDKMKTSNQKSRLADDPAITEALKIGERLSKWIALVNTVRTPENAIRLTSPLTRRGIPIEKPNTYSPALIKIETQTVLKALPKELREILLSSVELPTVLPVDDELFITFARKVDRNYQSAARYKSVDMYRSYYIMAANKDVRGYHYLTTQGIGENELQERSSIPAEQVKPIKDALVLICLNATMNLKKCMVSVEAAFKQNTLGLLYSQHMPAAKRIWDSFFKIPPGAQRDDVIWLGNIATVPFNTPEIPKFIPYLKTNIEDEFRFGPWMLKLNFGIFPDGPLLKFEPGVVPHVNGLGGNEIVMDANQPIEEYESQWTIRHEFGHVVGLPDCYHEFYDVKARAYVNYQLDINDLMCSRAGNMNERIFLELQKAYAK